MKKIKAINLINLIICLFVFVITMVINIVLYFNKNGFTFAAFMLAIVGVINLIFICIREGLVITYDTKRYTLVLHAAHILLGVLLYYVAKYVEGFYNLQAMYWILLIISIIIPIVVVHFLNKNDEKNKKKNSIAPKFVMNK